MHHSKSLCCTLSAVDIMLSLLTFFINTSRYTSNTTSTRPLREATVRVVNLSDHMEHSSRGDLHYVLGLSELFQKYHPSARGSTCKEKVSQANPVVEEPVSASQEQERNHSGDGSLETSEQYKTRSGRAIRRPLRFKDNV